MTSFAHAGGLPSSPEESEGEAEEGVGVTVGPGGGRRRGKVTKTKTRRRQKNAQETSRYIIKLASKSPAHLYHPPLARTHPMQVPTFSQGPPLARAYL